MTTGQPPGRRSRPVRGDDELAGHTVLVAGTAHTTARAAVLLSAAGANPVPAAVITTVAVASDEVDTACTAVRAGEYAWLVITSSAAWRVLRRRPGFLDCMTSRRPVRVAVVGPATADAVKADGVHPLVPDEAGGAASLVAPLIAAARADDPETPARILFACGDLARSVLTDGLRDAGLDVDVVVVYSTAPVDQPPAEALAVWRSGAVDDVVLTSPSAVEGLLTVLGPPPARAASLTGQDRPRLRIAAIGDTTAAAAIAKGLRVDVVGDASLAGVVRLLANPPTSSRTIPAPVRLPAPEIPPDTDS